MLPEFKYDSYQDVRRNLFWYAIVPLAVAGFSAYAWLVPPGTRAATEHWFDQLPLQGLWKSASGLVLFALLAFIFVEILKIHDRWYDKYVIRWRSRFDADFILPRLLRDFWPSLSNDFHDKYRANAQGFLEQLYYRYVGDRDTKIRKNLVVRFYERVTKYWLTQVNEIVLVFLFASVTVCRFVGPETLAYRTRLLDATLLLALLFVLNRAWVNSSRREVAKATQYEIDDILANHTDDLAKQLAKVRSKYGVS